MEWSLYQFNIQYLRMVFPFLWIKESCVDEESRKIGIAPLDIAVKNASKPDTLVLYQTYNSVASSHFKMRFPCGVSQTHPDSLHHKFHVGDRRGSGGPRGGDEKVGPVVRGRENSRGAVVGVAMVTEDCGEDECVSGVKVLAWWYLGMKTDLLTCGAGLCGKQDSRL